jgi:TrmH family RNA methyltransferase
MVISSAENPRYRQLLKLAESGRERRKSNLTLLDGIHLVQAYRAHVGAPEELIVSRSGLQVREVQALVDAAPEERVVVVGDGLFRALSTVATPTGVIALAKVPAVRAPHADIGPCVMLEDIQDPGNLGSILRSAAAAGVEDVLLSAGCAQAWSPRVLRAGMGAQFVLRLYEHCDLTAFAATYRGRVLATAVHGGTPLYDADLGGDVALALGNEGAGLTAALARHAAVEIAIPMPGRVESLNVAAAAAICLFERARQLART